MSEVKTLILRFRDLSISDTVKAHQDIINEKGYVWWGWWAKPQEKLPANVFIELNKVKNLNVFLFDSGNKKFYKSLCQEIKFDHSGEKFLPQETDAIPAYYREQKYYAWFKFESINECEFFTNPYSYVEIDGFFVDKNDFRDFNNKKVCSADELFLQQRTIWFIRDFKEGDTTQEIRLLSERNIIPRCFDEYYTQLKGNSILWLSDLHFSKDYSYLDGKTVNHHNFGRSVHDNDKLSNQLKQGLDNVGIIPDAVIITGDLTFSADEEEYKETENFLREISSTYNIHSSRIALCPGNHDFSFSENPSKKESPVEKSSDVAQANFRAFYQKFFCCEPNKFSCSIKRFLTKSLVPVEIICINSIMLEQEKGMFQGMGYVGQEQLDYIKENLDKNADTNAVRILVLHHHLLPITYSETPRKDYTYSITLDVGRINEFVSQYGIKLVLHGHGHKNYYAKFSAEEDKEFHHIIGLGSTGAIKEDLTDGTNNMFGVIMIEKDKIIIKEYEVFPNGQQPNVLKEIEIEV